MCLCSLIQWSIFSVSELFSSLYLHVWKWARLNAKRGVASAASLASNSAVSDPHKVACVSAEHSGVRKPRARRGLARVAPSQLTQVPETSGRCMAPAPKSDGSFLGAKPRSPWAHKRKAVAVDERRPRSWKSKHAGLVRAQSYMGSFMKRRLIGAEPLSNLSLLWFSFALNAGIFITCTDHTNCKAAPRASIMTY